MEFDRQNHAWFDNRLLLKNLRVCCADPAIGRKAALRLLSVKTGDGSARFKVF